MGWSEISKANCWGKAEERFDNLADLRVLNL
jgi:hypothetical protein